MLEVLQIHLRAVASQLSRFLETQLPEIGGASWWTSHVLNQLTYGQQGQVRTRNITSLGGLDLAALLRVFDRNWAELSHTGRLPNEVRTHAKEIADLRHAIAHNASERTEVGAADAYRHLDTLGRLLMALSADESVVKAVDESKTIVLKLLAGEMTPVAPETPPPAASPALPTGGDSVPAQTQPPMIRDVAMLPETTSSSVPSDGIEVGSFRLVGPGESIATGIANFDGRAVAATAIPWKAIGPKGMEFLIHVVLIDDDADGEFGQVFCESRLGSPQVWDDIVHRLRVGIRRLADGQLIMDLRVAIRENGDRAAKRIIPLKEIDKITGLGTAAVLRGVGAAAVGTRAELTGETNRTRNWPCVIFDATDLVTPAAAFVVTTMATCC